MRFPYTLSSSAVSMRRCPFSSFSDESLPDRMSRRMVDSETPVIPTASDMEIFCHVIVLQTMGNECVFDCLNVRMGLIVAKERTGGVNRKHVLDAFETDFREKNREKTVKKP